MRVVLDALALLAYLQDEPETDTVDAVLAEITVNGSEVVRKSLAEGVNAEGLQEDIEALDVQLEAFASGDAECAARIWPAAASSVCPREIAVVRPWRSISAPLCVQPIGPGSI